MSPSNDLDSMDWTQALFGGLGMKGDYEKASPGGNGAGVGRTQTQTQTQNMMNQGTQEEQDLFSFTVDEDQSGSAGAGAGGGDPGGTNHSSHVSGITGDLDRDLGFQTGDEMF